jgi:tRNA(fMet)-specific endonuclease VapC
MPSFGSEQPRRLVLDTSAYSRMLQRHAQVLDLVADASQVVLSAVTLGELQAGFEIGTQAAKNRRTLQMFLDEPYVEVADISADIALQYGRIFAKLRAAGTPLPTNDIWIAATAIDRGGQLVTFDRHFGHIPNLEALILE